MFEKAFHGAANRFEALSRNLVFTRVNWNYEREILNLAAWGKYHPDPQAQIGVPEFVDPAGYDFRLREDAFATDADKRLPLLKVNPQRIDEARQFREWVKLGIGLNESTSISSEEERN